LSHPFSLANALTFAAMLHLYRGEVQSARERAEAVMALSTEQGFPHWLAEGTMLRGLALAELGQEEEGITQIRRGMTTWRATGAELGWPGFLAWLAEAYGRGGQPAEGLRALAEALAAAEKTGQRYWDAELHRLYGELSLRDREPETGRTGDTKPLSASPLPRFPVSSPEESFQKAIDIAQQQQAKALELRAAVSLARLWQQRGENAEARRLVEEIYGWFTEGFDTSDLQAAEALLRALA
jgi:predicted ATPase